MSSLSLPEEMIMAKARTPLSIFLLLLLLAGCATAPAPVPPHQNMMAKTDDLGMVADWSLQMADKYGAGRVLVVFDIDNTLLAMEQGLGSDTWYYWQKDLAQTDPCSDMLVSDRFQVQGALFYASAMRPTQEDAAAQLRRIQDAGIPVIALTSRGTDYRLQTFRELRRNGMVFWPNALPPQRGWPESFVPEGGSRPARYEDGVFLTAGQHKGAMLSALLARTGAVVPDIVVVADDKRENLAAVMETYEGSATSVHAWRYSREDAVVNAFDPQQAADEWEALRPSLVTLEQLLGPDHFSLPAPEAREGCQNN